MLGSNCYMYVGRCMHGEPEDPGNIQQVYVGPNVLYLSHMLLYIVFERLNGSLTKMLMTTYNIHLEVLVYYVRVAVHGHAGLLMLTSPVSKLS